MDTVFERLWVKQTVPNTIYVDLFRNLRDTPVFRDSVLEPAVSDDQKNDTLAVEHRSCGNRFIKDNDYKAAIEQYNKSLCFAENGTAAISLAYANRAYCFLKLKMYNECLNDIELAINADYPEESMGKLEQRKALCLKWMDTCVVHIPIKPQLNFESSDVIQHMANVVTIERNDKFGRHLKATRHIDEDRVILIEDPLVKLLDTTNKYKRCYSCLKQYTSMVPCGHCTNVLFCSGECASSAKLHKYECNMKHRKLFDGSNALNCVQFVLRMVLRGLETFSSPGEFMEYVEFIRADNNMNPVIVADESFESLVGILLCHYRNVSYAAGQLQVLIISCFAYDYIMGHAELKTNFLTEKIQRFLMHLVVQFALTYSANNILLQDWSENWSEIIDHDSVMTFGAGVFNISSYINHACMPNVVRLTSTDQVVIKTIRPIKAGEQIFVRYAVNANWSTARRQRQLFRLCGFKCECSLCQCNGPLVMDVSVVSKEFANLSAELAPLVFLKVKETHKWATIKDKLFQFVKEFDGLELPVSKSIILAYEYIRMILTREFSCSTNV